MSEKKHAGDRPAAATAGPYPLPTPHSYAGHGGKAWMWCVYNVSALQPARGPRLLRDGITRGGKGNPR